MALSPEEKAQLDRLLNKAAEPVHQTVPIPPYNMAEFESRMRQIVAEAGINSTADRLKTMLPMPIETPPVKQPEPVQAPPTPGADVFGRLRDIAMGALTPEQLGKVVKMGLMASAQHGPQAAQKMLMDAGLNFLETAEGKDLIRIGVDAFFGAIAKQEEQK